MKMEQTEYCEKPAHKFQMSGIHPEERIQQGKSNYVTYLEHGHETNCDGLDLCIDEKVSRVNAEFWCEIFWNIIKQYTARNILIWKWKKMVYLGFYIKEFLSFTVDIMLG